MVKVKTKSFSVVKMTSFHLASVGKVPAHDRDAFLRIAFPPRAVRSSQASHWKRTVSPMFDTGQCNRIGPRGVKSATVVSASQRSTTKIGGSNTLTVKH